MSLIEELAALEHDQWQDWSRNLACTEKLSDKRMERWKSLWVSYNDLSERQKAQDRMWAKMALEVVRRHLVTYVPALSNLFDQCILRGWLEQELGPSPRSE